MMGNYINLNGAIVLATPMVAAAYFKERELIEAEIAKNQPPRKRDEEV